MATRSGKCIGGPYHGKSMVVRGDTFVVAQTFGGFFVPRKEENPRIETLTYKWSEDLGVFLCVAPDLPRIR